MLVGLVLQVKPPLLLVHGHRAPGPTACQFIGRLACVLPLLGWVVGGLSQSVQSIQFWPELLVPTLTTLANGMTEM